MIDVDRLRESLKGEVYRDLRVFLTLKLNQLRDIDTIQEHSKAQDQAIEVKAQKRAYKKLEQILSEIINVGETEKIVNDTAHDYGVEDEDYIQKI